MVELDSTFEGIRAVGTRALLAPEQAASSVVGIYRQHREVFQPSPGVQSLVHGVDFGAPSYDEAIFQGLCREDAGIVPIAKQHGVFLAFASSIPWLRP